MSVSRLVARKVQSGKIEILQWLDKGVSLMEPPISPIIYAVLLFIGMLVLLETGRRLGVRRRPKEVEGERGNLGTIEGAVFALFGLLMAWHSPFREPH
jgi:hypothetical protein